MIVKAALEGLTTLLSNLWLETYPLSAELLSLAQHNTREMRARVEWAAEYETMKSNFLFRLNLDLKNWCISVEEEVGDIDLPIMTTQHF